MTLLFFYSLYTVSIPLLIGKKRIFNMEIKNNKYNHRVEREREKGTHWKETKWKGSNIWIFIFLFMHKRSKTKKNNLQPKGIMTVLSKSMNFFCCFYLYSFSLFYAIFFSLLFKGSEEYYLLYYISYSYLHILFYFILHIYIKNTHTVIYTSTRMAMCMCKYLLHFMKFNAFFILFWCFYIFIWIFFNVCKIPLVIEMLPTICF